MSIVKKDKITNVLILFILGESGHLEERRPLFYGRPNRQRLEQSVTFHGLRLDQIYKVRAATVMNGLQISYFEIDYKPQ